MQNKIPIDNSASASAADDTKREPPKFTLFEIVFSAGLKTFTPIKVKRVLSAPCKNLDRTKGIGLSLMSPTLERICNHTHKPEKPSKKEIKYIFLVRVSAEVISAKNPTNFKKRISLENASIYAVKTEKSTTNTHIEKTESAASAAEVTKLSAVSGIGCIFF